MVGTGLLVRGKRAFGATPDPINQLRKFVAPLPLPGSGLSLAAPDKTLYGQTGAQADFYRIVMGQFRQSLHPDLPPSKLWGYADATNCLPKWSYLGANIVATKGTPVRINYINLLPPVHPLPIDTTLPGAETGQKVNRAAPHLHGGFVVWPSDGGPFHWTTPLLHHGPSWVRWLPNRLGIKTDDYYYCNEQTARFMWYHDHAVGITRLNAYAGLAAGYFLIDGDELRMFGSGGSVLPDQIPGVPLILQDKSFKNVADQWGRVGDLDYPTDYGPAEEGFPGTPPMISTVPEFFADTPIINGMAYPELTLPAGVHRFRLLNGTQSRVWNLQLYREDASNPGDADTTQKGPDFIQIGTEGGFLPAPVVVESGNQYNPEKHNAHDTTGYSLVLAGAERADLLIDFSDCAGQSFILYNDALSPFPDGGDEVDYYTGGPGGAPNSTVGPNTRTLMRIEITPATYTGLTGGALVEKLKTELAANELGLLIPDGVITASPGTVPEAPEFLPKIRTLSEGVDPYGRLIALLGTDFASGQDNTVYGMHYLDPLRDDEKHAKGGCEVWDIYNTTGDTHPVHFHLVNVQILGRTTFFQDPVDGTVEFTPIGPWVAPDLNERGFKETVRMNPGEVIRVIMKFDLPPNPVVNVLGRNKTVNVPTSPRTGGLEYVWHCHILEHEEHDMMRPLVVF
jgi:spore coat protein A